MNAIENIVDHTFVINLAHRTDRWENVKKELESIGYGSYERFDAYGVKNQPPEEYHEDIKPFEMSGWYGNKFSHYGVIESARDWGYRSVMVFEDDVIFHPSLFNKTVEKALGQLRDLDWDWLQFGGNHRYFGGVSVPASPIDGMPYLYVADGLTGVTPNLSRVIKMLTAHAYIVRESAYDFILENAIKSSLSIDGFYAYEVHPRFKCYCVTPCVTNQTPGTSDIGNCYSDCTQYIGD